MSSAAWTITECGNVHLAGSAGLMGATLLAGGSAADAAALVNEKTAVGAGVYHCGPLAAALSPAGRFWDLGYLQRVYSSGPFARRDVLARLAV